MPVKNTGTFLGECLDSILKQTLQDWELIAVDDHSTDDSYDILASYADHEGRIKALKNIGDGIIMALRTAYRTASGQYITRMDSDDIMAPDKLELLSKRLRQKDKGHIAVGLVEYFSESELGEGYQNYAQWLNELTYTESNFSDIYKECAIPSPCWMVDRFDLDRCGGFMHDVYPEDYDLAFRFRKAGLKITSVKKVIHLWRDYTARTSRTDDNYSDNRFSELKIKHFLNQDHRPELPLILWGAGKKGKKIANLLKGHQVSFRWICNNPNKINKEIYGIYMEALSVLSFIQKAQVIIAVSSPKDTTAVEALMLQNDQNQYFRFC